MPRTAKKQNQPGDDNALRKKWSDEINRAKKRFRTFHYDGDRTLDEYQQQAENGNNRTTKDKYNILFSTTETIRPNLYAQLPVVRVVLRNKDMSTNAARDGAMLLQNCGQYLIEENDFDSLMDGVAEDLLLPGLGQAWVRYEPNFKEQRDPETNKPVLDENGEPELELLDEMVRMDYLYWKDWLCSSARTWKSVTWVAKRCWMDRETAVKRFGSVKAGKLSYGEKEQYGNDSDEVTEAAEVWEIWDKKTKKALWFAESYPDALLDVRDDPLRLKEFFPCPRPLRAVSTTRKMVPRALYSQYKEQQEQINNITRRIRLLTDALRVAGVFNGAEPKISDLLNSASGNKMIPVADWHNFKGDGGIAGAIEWLPIKDVVSALQQLLQAREVCKAEIYEITGFSDILRGVSKASETLGAQNIKANWGGARLKRMQKEVQRFARDMINLAGEIVAEHCQPSTIELFGNIGVPETATDEDRMRIRQRLDAAIAFIREEARRVAAINIETDSTLLADETAEREDRMTFLSSAGAFLQQAVPAMQQQPEMGALLASMLMFTIRTFPSSRVIEDAFENTIAAIQAKPPTPPQENQPDKTKVEAAQITAQADVQRTQTEMGMREKELLAKTQAEAAKTQLEQQQEANRSREAMTQLRIKEMELEIKRAELRIKERELGLKGEELDLKEDVARAEMDARQQELNFQAEENAVAWEREEREAAQTPLTGAEE